MQRRLCFTFFFSFAVLWGCSTQAPDPVSLPLDQAHLEKGRYLATGLAACGFCHGNPLQPGAPMSGGLQQADMYGEVAAANITPAKKTGLGNWGALDLIRALRGSVNPDEERISKDIHEGYEWMSDEDLFSILTYIRVQPPVEKEIERRSISFLDRNTTGFWEVTRDLKGFVPEIEKRHSFEYGEYLVDNVARCGFCHNRPGEVLSAAEYLGGGRAVNGPKGEKVAPAINGAKFNGAKGWTEEDIVQYLRTGATPFRRTADPSYCPIAYYRNVAEDDLHIVARYLKKLPS